MFFTTCSKLKHFIYLALQKLYRAYKISFRPIKEIQNLLIQEKNFILTAR
jgi:hypothetical protein